MMPTLLLAALALQTMPAPTLDRWEGTGSDAIGESAIDPQSISRTGDVVTVIVRTRIHRSESTGGAILGVMRYTYNCRTDRVRMLAADVYDANGRFAGTAEAGPEEQIRPDSPNQRTRDRVCR
ncbi:MAG TPA: surface-adhesin E family protein [Allosphingosinicella sp.]|nr:surface-adhesin E family protein [Allosphingosinicella sp.]